MIENGKDNGFNTVSAGLPDVSVAVHAFLQQVIIQFVQTQMIDGYSKDIRRQVRTMASVQPMDEKLAIRKEGERSWRWSVVHMSPDPGLSTDDVFELLGTTYRIMQKMNWGQYGYTEFHCIEEYKVLR